MDHSAHAMMNHSGHAMMDHSAHAMMDHSAHAMMNHSAHAMMNHTAHAVMNATMDHSGHSMNHMIMDATTESVHKMMDMGHSMHQMSDMPHMDMGMDMYFTAKVDAYIWFKEWHTTTAWELVIACIGLFLLAMIYEGFKLFREELLSRSHRNAQASRDSMTSGTSSAANIFTSPDGRSWRKAMFNGGHVLQSFLHIIQVALSYLLMLAFMTFNVYLCLAVVLGAGVGYFLFCWRRLNIVDATEHCH